MQNIISAHNKSVLNKEAHNSQATAKESNCHRKENCSLSGKGQITGIVYQATVKREESGEEKSYVGLTEGPFKTRFNHTSSFRNPQHKHATELSTYIWNLEESDTPYSIKSRIIK